MAANAGPDIVEDGIVFYYDTGNTVKSYIGEPTTNLATDTLLDSGWPGYSTLISSSTKTFDLVTSTVEWGGDGSWTMFYYDVSAYTGQSISIAATYESSYSPGGGNLAFVMIGQTTGSETYLGYSSPLDYNSVSPTTGQRISWSGTVGNGGKIGILTWMNNGNSTTLTSRFSKIQVEIKSHPTQFVNGSRSVTQGLLDITANSTINLTDVSFDSNAKIVFDGTNDKIQGVQTVLSYLSSSAIEFVVTPTVVNKRMTVGGYRHNDGYSQPTIGMVYIGSDNVFRAYVITAAQVYRGVASTTTLQANKTYHVVYNKDTVNGVMQMYVNGNLEATETFDAATYGQWTTAGSYIGSNYIDIGKSNNTNAGQGWSNDYLVGEIELFKLYSKVLTASEVLTNYNALKTRFGI
jgi:hypothetical protein